MKPLSTETLIREKAHCEAALESLDETKPETVILMPIARVTEALGFSSFETTRKRVKDGRLAPSIHITGRGYWSNMVVHEYQVSEIQMRLDAIDKLLALRAAQEAEVA